MSNILPIGKKLDRRDPTPRDPLLDRSLNKTTARLDRALDRLEKHFDERLVDSDKRIKRATRVIAAVLVTCVLLVGSSGYLIVYMLREQTRLDIWRQAGRAILTDTQTRLRDITKQIHDRDALFIRVTNKMNADAPAKRR